VCLAGNLYRKRKDRGDCLGLHDLRTSLSRSLDGTGLIPTRVPLPGPDPGIPVHLGQIAFGCPALPHNSDIVQASAHALSACRV
jgi:hypothetical protein